jgi:hypothetical protein
MLCYDSSIMPKKRLTANLKFINRWYIEISEIIRNRIERGWNDCYDISLTMRSIRSLFWEFLYQ